MMNYRNWYLFSAGCAVGAGACFLAAGPDATVREVVRLMPVLRGVTVVVLLCTLAVLVSLNRGVVRLPPFKMAGPRAGYRRYDSYRRVK